MRYKKYLLLSFSLASLFALASCNNINGANESKGTLDNADVRESTSVLPGDTTIVEPSYALPSLSIEEITSSSFETAVERTVKEVYETTVSLTCTSTSQMAKGSGVIFAEDSSLGLSYIVTCLHVIDGANNYTVTLSDGTTEYDAMLVGGSYDYDLAVLAIKATGLKHAKLFSDSDKIALGSEVVCIGNPLGSLPGSVSSGIVSFINRKITTSNYTIMNLIQTDVAINSGNSGGALFNTSGALIGIVNAKYSSSGIEGLGFAIPINDVKKVINSVLATAKYDVNNDLFSHGNLEGDWELGFTISDGLYGNYFDSQSVVYIKETSQNKTTSGYNGLKVNDIIKSVKIDYKDDSKEDITLDFSSAGSLLLAINQANLRLDDSIIFEVVRNNSTVSVMIKLVQYTYEI